MKMMFVVPSMQDGEASYAVHRLDLNGMEKHTSACAISGVVIDARSMSRKTVTAALDEIGEVRRRLGVGHALLIAHHLDLEVVVAAMRAGITDVASGALSVLRFVRFVSMIGGSGAVSTVIDLVRLWAPRRAVGQSFAVQALHDREAEMKSHGEALTNKERRLEERAAMLRAREAELKSARWRVGQDIAALQLQAEEARTATQEELATVRETVREQRELLRQFEAQLQERSLEIDERERALALRESMFQEMDELLRLAN